MSTKSLKRLTNKAKRSISGLNPFWDGGSSLEKESDTPDLEDFGSTRTYASSTYSNAHPLSPTKDSPSRRSKLMGPLRGMSSLRSLRSSPQKVKGIERAEPSVSPEGPRTPMREVTSLALNFRESPPGQPMFGALQRKRSISSSLVVQHSSPVPIPTSFTEDYTTNSITAHHFVPAGTVPDSPGPLQKALERDLRLSPNVTDPSPVHPQTGDDAELLSTPMPGTNISYNHNDLNGSAPLSHGPEVLLSHISSETSDYFDMPIAANSAHTELISVEDGAVQRTNTPALWKHLDGTTLDGDASAPIGSSREITTDLHDGQASRCDSLVTGKDLSHTERDEPVTNAEFEPAVNFQPHGNEMRPAEDSPSSINIEHIVFEESPEVNTTKHQSAQQVYVIRQAEAQMDLQMQALQVDPKHNSTAHEIQTSTADGMDSVPAPNTWGTHGSLYDGTGYGEASSSTSTRPSTSSTHPDIAKETTSGNKYTAKSLAQDSAAMARDHEALEEVIRAYAALEEKATFGASEDIWEDVVADDRTSHE